MGKDFLSLRDLSKREIMEMLRLTCRLRKGGRVLRGRNIAMVFAKPSTRTRTSFEVAINQLGGNSIYLDVAESQLGRGETIQDTGRVLGRYVDGIVARLFSHKDILLLAEGSRVPVINALTDLLHPCQALSDMYTIRERLKRLEGLRLVFLGDGGSNVCHSLMYACSKLGLKMVVSCPRAYSPDKVILKETGVGIVRNPREAARKADILYTDTWVSMGDRESGKRTKALRPYQLNQGIVKLAKPGALVMHCLPAHRGQEITSQVMDGKNSVIFEQAENRLHTAKGIMAFLF